MKKIPQKYRDFVIECCQKSAWNIGVTHFKVDIKYMDEDSKDKDGSLIQGEMHTDRRYLHGTMKLYPCVLKKWEMKEKNSVKEIVFHEIAHLASQHLYDVATSRYCDDGEMDDAWETCTEVIARMSLVIDELKNKKP